MKMEKFSRMLERNPDLADTIFYHLKPVTVSKRDPEVEKWINLVEYVAFRNFDSLDTSAACVTYVEESGVAFDKLNNLSQQFKRVLAGEHIIYCHVSEEESPCARAITGTSGETVDESIKKFAAWFKGSDWQKEGRQLQFDAVFKITRTWIPIQRFHDQLASQAIEVYRFPTGYTVDV